MNKALIWTAIGVAIVMLASPFIWLAVVG